MGGRDATEGEVSVDRFPKLRGQLSTDSILVRSSTGLLIRSGVGPSFIRSPQVRSSVYITRLILVLEFSNG